MFPPKQHAVLRLGVDRTRVSVAATVAFGEGLFEDSPSFRLAITWTEGCSAMQSPATCH